MYNTVTTLPPRSPTNNTLSNDDNAAGVITLGGKSISRQECVGNVPVIGNNPFLTANDVGITMPSSLHSGQESFFFKELSSPLAFVTAYKELLEKALKIPLNLDPEWDKRRATTIEILNTVRTLLHLIANDYRVGFYLNETEVAGLMLLDLDTFSAPYIRLIVTLPNIKGGGTALVKHAMQKSPSGQLIIKPDTEYSKKMCQKLGFTLSPDSLFYQLDPLSCPHIWCTNSQGHWDYVS